MQLHNRVNGAELKAKMRQSSEERTTISFYKYLNPIKFMFFHFF